MVHTILVGDAREQLASLPDQIVQCCVTSPPYYGLRDYGVEGQIGLESTVEDYVTALVDVFREVRRVLRDDGTLWLNLGDSYASQNGGQSRKPTDGLKPKDLIGIPWRVAFALQADGWWLRQDIIWHKPNPMPESVRDRCTKSHEYIFLFSKSPRYYFDADAIAEAVVRKQNTGQRFGGHKYGDDADEQSRTKSGNVFTGSETRNKRSVWTVSTKPYTGAHFATFPTEIPETCIKAGTSERGQCRECGAPWVRVVERGKSTPDLTQRSTSHYNTADRYGANNGGNGGFDKLAARMRAGENGKVTKGWEPSCTCDAGDPVPQVVLDPFAGSGTTGEVAEFLGRRVILIELNPAYVPLIEKRLAQRTIWDALSVAD